MDDLALEYVAYSIIETKDKGWGEFSFPLMSHQFFYGLSHGVLGLINIPQLAYEFTFLRKITSMYVYLFT